MLKGVVMPKWLIRIIITLLVIAALVVVAALVSASFHNVSLGAELQQWFNAIKNCFKPAKDAAKTTAEIVLK